MIVTNRRKYFPLQPRPVHKGYIKTVNGWCYVSSNLHSRINARVGLWRGGYDVNGKFIGSDWWSK